MIEIESQLVRSKARANPTRLCNSLRSRDNDKESSEAELLQYLSRTIR